MGGSLSNATSNASYRKILDGTYHDDQINTVLALLNVEREKAGAPAVKLDPVLQKLAKARAKESTGLMTHIRPDGLKYQVEFNKTGMYTKMGESVASVPSAPEFIESLMNHAPHRHAVINPEFTQVGIGVCEAEDGRFFWEIVYGRQGSLYNPNFKLKDLSLLYRKLGEKKTTKEGAHAPSFFVRQMTSYAVDEGLYSRRIVTRSEKSELRHK